MRARRLAGLAFGVLFGFTLGWARLTDYDVIIGMLRLTDLQPYFIMAGAMVTGGLGVRLLRGAGARTLVGDPVGWTQTRPTATHVYGAVLFGAGWAVTGTCPGPALAQIGRGQLIGLFTALGLLLGVMLRGWVMRRGEARAMPEQAPSSVL